MINFRKIPSILSFPLWLAAHIFQSQKTLKLSRIFNNLSTKKDISNLETIPVETVQLDIINPQVFKKLLYLKKPLLIRGYGKGKIKEFVDHKFLIENFGEKEEYLRMSSNATLSPVKVKDFLNKNEFKKSTIASNNLMNEKKIKDAIAIEDWLPNKLVLNAPLLQKTLFASSQGFNANLHMEAGRLLNIQLSGKKTWYLISPKYSNDLTPELSDTTIHFSQKIKNTSDLKKKLNSSVEVYECTMNEGDLLLIPPYFWHIVENHEDSVSVTYQWLTLFKPFIENPLMSLFLITSRKPSVFDVIRRK